MGSEDLIPTKQSQKISHSHECTIKQKGTFP